MRATVAIPTLHGRDPLERCLDSLWRQTAREFEAVVIDNSGGKVYQAVGERPNVRWIVNAQNAGFGRAVNQAIASSSASYVLSLNDDAYPDERWLEELLAAADARPDAGMCASRIVLAAAPDRLDSAGLDIYPDGVTKQHGHGQPSANHAAPCEALMPSGCAALYRRAMLDETGGFDEDYFLYGEDAELGLRGRLAGWTCLYVPSAVVRHDYSKSAGRASRLKAFYVERNRLYTVLKLFPWPLAAAAPLFAFWRYVRHVLAALRGHGLAGEFARSGENPFQLVLIVMSAHWETLRRLPALLRKRRAVRRRAVLGCRAFWKLLRRHSVSAAGVAAQ